MCLFVNLSTWLEDLQERVHLWTSADAHNPWKRKSRSIQSCQQRERSASSLSAAVDQEGEVSGGSTTMLRAKSEASSASHACLHCSALVCFLCAVSILNSHFGNRSHGVIPKNAEQKLNITRRASSRDERSAPRTPDRQMPRRRVDHHDDMVTKIALRTAHEIWKT